MKMGPYSHIVGLSSLKWWPKSKEPLDLPDGCYKPTPMKPRPPQTLLHFRRNKQAELEMGATQAMKRIPLIKFPQRHPKTSGSTSASSAASAAGNAQQSSFTRMKVPIAPSNVGAGGKASLQPKRTPLSNEEIEAILLGGCF